MALHSCSFENFQSLHFNPFHNESFSDTEDERDPGQTFFNESNTQNFECSYLFPNEIEGFLSEKENSEDINAIHLNIRSLSKNFDNLLDILRDSNYSFNILCITETWCTDSNLKSNSNLHLPNFDLISQERKTNKRGSGVLIYIHKRLKCNLRYDLCVSDKHKEILTIEISRENDKNILLSCCYRPPNGDRENLSTFLQNNIIEKSVSEKKISYMIGDFNMNCLKYHENVKTKYFYNNIFEKGAIPIINRPNRISELSASLIDNLLTTDIFNNSLKKGMIKSDVSDHFPIFFSIRLTKEKLQKGVIKIKERVSSKHNITAFKEQLSLLHWRHIDFNGTMNEIYDTFLKTLTDIFDANFPICEYIFKDQDIKSPWVSKGLKKSSKTKQRLYIKLLKTKTLEDESKYKNYKSLFEKLRKKAKILYYSKLLHKHKTNSKWTWEVMKEITGKQKTKSNLLPREIKVNKTIIQKPQEIAKEFTKFFTSVEPTLVGKMPNTEKSFQDFLTSHNEKMQFEELNFNEFEEAFKSLKRNKAEGYDDVSSSIIMDAYDSLKNILFDIFKVSIKQGIFPDSLKIAKVTPIFKSGAKDNRSNYHPISILPLFSKVLKRIMYNRVYNHLNSKGLLYEKTVWFSKK